MSMSDPIADMLTRIRNGQRVYKDVVEAPASKIVVNILEVLKREGYILGYNKQEVRKGVNNLSIELKYHDGLPVIQEITRISKPGLRVYSSITDLGKVYNGLGITVISTPKGVLSDAEARVANVGGEVLCSVF